VTLRADAALIAGLRRPGDEAQLTQVLASVFQAEPEVASAFLGVVLGPTSPSGDVPSQLTCSAEEVVEEGRTDLRFRAESWDVIVELKIYASYGRQQLGRYLAALTDVEHAYVAAITRAVPTYGEPPKGADPRWLGSAQWRQLLPGLRAIRPANGGLRSQWPLLLDVLEVEGSMGFTRADPELFKAFATMRTTLQHTDQFVAGLQMPLWEALIDALGGDVLAASLYKGRGGRPVISRSRNGVTDIPFRIPPDGPPRVRAGLFARNPPTRFYVAPHAGRRWVARRGRLTQNAQAAIRHLVDRGFRDSDLHIFLELDDGLLTSPDLERRVVEWAHARFVDIAESGILSCTAEPDLAQTAGEDAGDVE
jgi:hypothetical protein